VKAEAFKARDHYSSSFSSFLPFPGEEEKKKGIMPALRAGDS
jgi:hypothetical protein